MRRKSKTLGTAIVVCLVAATAFICGNAAAQVIAIRPSLGQPQTVPSAVPGVVVNDISVDFTGRLHGFQMLVELTGGSIYQNPSVFSGSMPPLQALEPIDPTLATDSYTAFGGPYFDDNAGNYALGGGAVSLGGGPIAQFDTEAINQAWNPAGGVDVIDGTDFLAARVAFSEDATGRIQFAGFAGDGSPADAIRLDLPIVGGVIGGAAIPEPATIVMTAAMLIGIVIAGRSRHPRVCS